MTDLVREIFKNRDVLKKSEDLENLDSIENLEHFKNTKASESLENLKNTDIAETPKESEFFESIKNFKDLKQLKDFKKLKKSFGFGMGKPVGIDHKKRAYDPKESIAQQLPWMEYDAQTQCFLLQDALSVAAMFEIEDVACEASSEEYLLELRDRFQGLFQNTFPQESEGPWHLQFFLQDELSLDRHIDEVKAYVKPLAKGSEYTQDFFNIYEEHCKIMTKPGGLFRDNQVTGNIFQGRVRRIRLIIYRLLSKESKLRRGQDVLTNLNNVAKKVESKLKSADVHVRRCGGKDFYEWMVRWFNPNPKNGKITTDELLKQQPYPGDDEMLFGFDFVEQLFKSTPESDHEEAVWYFDQKPHALLTVQSLSSIPKVGHITAERQQGKQRYGLFDRMPEGSIFVMNIVIEHQGDVIKHIKEIYKSCAGNNVESVLARKDCEAALYQIEQGNHLFPTAMGVYVRGENIDQLNQVLDEAETILNNSGFMVIDPEVELAPCDAYLRFLPMAFDYSFDKSKGIRRSRYVYSRQIANMLPLYGRYRGTGNTCIFRWNRAGEPLCFDPLSKQDKSANSHVLYLAETGGGKSASLVWDLKSTIAIYNPRIFIIEAGDSFGLFCADAASLGKTVNQVKLSVSKPTPLNPFADALKVLDDTKNGKKLSVTRSDEKVNVLIDHLADEYDDSDEYDSDEDRDILGEMALAVQLMITGGDPAEEAKFTRANRTLVLEALVDAAKCVKDRGDDEVIAEDVVESFKRIAKRVSQEDNNPEKVARIHEMAESMMNFTTDKFSASFFNKKGKAWPDADITRLDMGLMKNEQYGAQLSLAVMGMLNRIAHIAETTQYQDRMTIVLIDESHIITKNPLTAASITQFSKMCRKLGMWLWLATQNMGDFPNESRKMLSMIEFWIGLGTSESEIDEIRRFKQITEEEKNLFMSVHKDIPNYVEGVVMSRKVRGLFRNVPPRIALALGMTEKDEKAKRLEFMQKHQVDELGAAKLMAQQMNEKLLEKN